jgi:hypothetical protein
VADRWHLLVNLREALQRLLDRLRPELNALLPVATCAKKSSGTRSSIPINSQDEKTEKVTTGGIMNVFKKY